MSATDEVDGLGVSRPHYGCECGDLRRGGGGAGFSAPRAPFPREGVGRAGGAGGRGPRGPGRAGLVGGRGGGRRGAQPAPLGVRGGDGDPGGLHALAGALRLEGLTQRRPPPSSAVIEGEGLG